MPEEVKRRISQSEKGKKVSIETRHKMRLAKLGKINDQCCNWVGDKVGYFGIHDWLIKNFGKANKCENLACKKISKIFQWAKLNDKEYERRRENFCMLCVSCHNIYDMTIEKRNKISSALKNYYKQLDD